MMSILITTAVISVFWLSLYGIKRKGINKTSLNRKYIPGISIIIPAFNEAKSIGSTLKSVLSSDYPKRKMDIIIVDDGSKDNTAGIASRFPVRLIKIKKNKGKVNALNLGIDSAKNDIIFTLDADSQVKPNFFRLMADHFRDKEVGAVCGIYKAKSQSRILEKFQGLEYLSFALLRKLQEALNAIIVVPGAVAAFRKEALLKVGKYEDDTMIEDMDATVKIHKAGYKVRCEKNALAYVSAPSTIRSFVSQRTRWMRGGMQIWGKHFDIFSGKLGAVGFLWMFDIFGIFMQFVVLGILVDRIFNFGISLEAIKLWLLNLLTLNLQAFDIIMILGAFTFAIGLVNMIISIRLTNDSMRKLAWYPLMAFYQTFQFMIFLKSMIEESLDVKRRW